MGPQSDGSWTIPLGEWVTSFKKIITAAFQVCKINTTIFFHLLNTAVLIAAYNTPCSNAK